MSIIYHTIPDLDVEVKEGAQLARISGQFLTCLYAIWYVCHEQGKSPVLTGASRDQVYDHEPLHQMGYAWDWRSEHLSDPARAAQELQTLLSSIDRRWRCVYIRTPGNAHYHIEYDVRKPGPN